MEKDQKISVLFVCLGNICRSPTAEAVFKEIVKEADLSDHFLIDSAGILAAHAGEPADLRMRRHARKRGYTLSSLSRKINEQDFDSFDYIIGMDSSNLHDLLHQAPDSSYRQKISLLLENAPDLNRMEVPDPYYGGAKGFEEVLDLVEAACKPLLKKIIDAN